MKVTGIKFPERGPQTEAVTAEELRRRGLKGPLFRFLAEYTVMVEIDGRWRAVTTPVGGETDWASIPGLAKCVIDDDDPRILAPSAAHDRIYEEQGNVDLYEEPIDRAAGDEILRLGMLACGASFSLAGAVYLAVRVGGGTHWKPSPK